MPSLHGVVTMQELVPVQAEALTRILPFGKLEPSTRTISTGWGRAPCARGACGRLRLPYRAAFVAELAGPESDEKASRC